MNLATLDRWLAHNLPTNVLKDVYPRAMRRLAEMGLPAGRNVTTTRHGFKMEVDRLDAIKWYVHYYGEFEPQISAAWKRLLKPGNVVVDIGGNVGYHALLAAECVGAGGKVLTFEPASQNFKDLVANVSWNSSTQVSVLPIAISDRPGEVFIRYAGDNEQGSSSIVRGDGPGQIVKAISFAEIASYTPLNSIDLIKIDVEGAEPLVIDGMMPVIDQLKPTCAIFVEVGPEHSGNELLAPFVKAGFKIREIANEYRTSFYRQPGDISLRPYVDHGRLADTVLCRDEAIFRVIEGA